jgi:DNA-binding CsgD family transcriptional regulator
MMGRDTELGRLRQAAEHVWAGHPTIVMVQGQAGVGKSRLVSEWMSDESVEGLIALIGHCVEVAGTELPYAPFVSAMRDLSRQIGLEAVRGLGGPAQSMMTGLLPALGEQPPDQPSRAALLDAVATVLSRLADQRPVALVLEDLHWSDASTRDLLSYLARSLTNQRLLILVTLRDEADWKPDLRAFMAELLRLPQIELVPLAALTAPDVAAQAADISGHPIPADRIAWLVKFSDGVPFLVEELLAADPQSEAEVPDRTRNVVLARLAGLSSDVRRVIDAAALAEAELSDHLLREVVGHTDVDVDAALHAAVDKAVLLIDLSRDGYRFRHALVRAAVGEVMLPGERRAWHRRWAEALERSGGGLEALQAAVVTAHHWHYAGDTNRALVAGIRAARECHRRSAYTEEALLLRRALGLWDRSADPETLTSLTHDGLVDDAYDAMVAGSAWADLAMMLTEQLRLSQPARDPSRHVLLSLRLTHVRSRLDGHLTPVDGIESMIDSVRAAPPTRDKVVAFQELASHLEDTSPLTAQRVLEEALTSARALGDPALIAGIRVDLALLRSAGGDYLGAVQELEAMQSQLDLLDPVRIGLAQQCRVLDLYMLGRLDEAISTAETALAAIAPSNAPFAWCAISAANVRALVASGQWDEVPRVLDGMRETPAFAQVPHIRTWLESLAGLLSVWRGQQGSGEPPHQTGDIVWCEPLRLRAETAIAQRDPLAVRDMLRQVWARPDLHQDRGDAGWLLLLAARAEADIAARARAIRDDAQLAEGAQMRLVLERAADHLRFLTPLGNAIQAHFEAEVSRWLGQNETRPWEVAAEAWAYVGVQHERGWALYWLAEAQLARARFTRRDTDSAALALRDAADIAVRLGAQPLQDEIASLARRARIELGAAQQAESTTVTETTRGSRLQLTPRELEVLALISNGSSNSQIAKDLYMSPKTASVHVSRILAKLGAHNRTEAATIAHRLGLFEHRH